MPDRVGGSLIETCGFPPSADVVDGEIAGPEPGPWAVSSCAPGDKPGVAMIVEGTWRRRDEPHGGRIPRPRAALGNQASPVETSPHVQSFGGRDQPAGTERHLVPPEPQRQRFPITAAPYQVDERLMQVECVFVGGPRSAGPARLEAALDLDESTGVRAEVPIGVQEVSLKHVPAWIVGLRSETRVTHALVPPTCFASR